MKHTYGKQAKRAGIALAVVGTFAALGIGTVQAAGAPVSAPTFLSATLSIEPGNGAKAAEAAGGLNCTWREAGVGAATVVDYACAAGAVGVLHVCTYKGRVIFNSPTESDSFKNVVGEEQHEVSFLSQANGLIQASTTTAIPTREVPEGQELCIPPSVEEVAAVRWCNASLTDTTNNLVGATASELFQEFIPGVGTVPSCEVLLAP